MKKYQKEIIKLSARELLLSFIDLASPFFQASRIYRQGANKYINERRIEKAEFWDKIKYLKRSGYIERFLDGNEEYHMLTQKGREKLEKLKFQAIKIKRPEKWNGKWWLVIFDVPDKKKQGRDLLRKKLISIDFEKIQESVYAYPFECADEIDFIAGNLNVGENVLIFIANAIRGEEVVIEKFLDKNILTKRDLQK